MKRLLFGAAAAALMSVGLAGAAMAGCLDDLSKTVMNAGVIDVGPDVAMTDAITEPAIPTGMAVSVETMLPASDMPILVSKADPLPMVVTSDAATLDETAMNTPIDDAITGAIYDGPIALHATATSVDGFASDEWRQATVMNVDGALDEIAHRPVLIG